jgi:hypothetical protein
MGYVVEVPVTEDDLNGQMNRMRAWLDHCRFEPRSFKLGGAGDRQVVQVLFKTESEAAAFATEFGGTQLAPPLSNSVAV